MMMMMMMIIMLFITKFDHLDASLLQIPHSLNNLKDKMKVPPSWNENLSQNTFFHPRSLGVVDLKMEKLVERNGTDLILEPILNSSRSNQCEALLHALVDLPHKLCPKKKWKFFKQIFKIKTCSQCSG